MGHVLDLQGLAGADEADEAGGGPALATAMSFGWPITTTTVSLVPAED